MDLEALSDLEVDLYIDKVNLRSALSYLTDSIHRSSAGTIIESIQVQFMSLIFNVTNLSPAFRSSNH